MGNDWEEESSQATSNLFVNVLQLRLLYIQLIRADFVHRIVLYQKHPICQTVHTPQTQTCIVGLQNDLP